MPEEPVSRQAAEERAEGTAELHFGTVSAEKADNGVSDTPMPSGSGGGPAPSATPLATMTAAPTPSEAADGAEALPERETELAPTAADVEPTPTAQMTRPSASGPEAAGATPPAVERPELRDTRAPSPFPWLAVQIGLGSAAVALLAATLWAWRMRR